jgi:hypothetical protein
VVKPIHRSTRPLTEASKGELGGQDAGIGSWFESPSDINPQRAVGQ